MRMVNGRTLQGAQMYMQVQHLTSREAERKLAILLVRCARRTPATFIRKRPLRSRTFHLPVLHQFGIMS